MAPSNTNRRAADEAKTNAPEPPENPTPPPVSPTPEEQVTPTVSEPPIAEPPAPVAEPATRHLRMRVKISGTRDGQDWPDVGATTEVPEGEAVELIANGYALDVDEEESATAATAGVETATPSGKRSIKSSRTAEDNS